MNPKRKLSEEITEDVKLAIECENYHQTSTQAFIAFNEDGEGYLSERSINLFCKSIDTAMKIDPHFLLKLCACNVFDDIRYETERRKCARKSRYSL